jgi:hypothetical protein
MAGSVDRAAKLLQRSFAEGELSQESTQALRAIGNIGNEVGEALGDDEGTGDLLLVTIVADDSSSIATIQGGPSAVRAGHNHCLDALELDQASDILVHTRYLTAGSLSPFSTLASALRLSSENYLPTASSTPLYKQSVLALGTVTAKIREQKERGRHVRAFTLLITDGEDNASGAMTAQHVNFLVRDMLEFSNDYIVAGMGIGPPEQFQPIFRRMGIPDGWILTADATPEDIRQRFQQVARSLQLAASGNAGWLQLEAGPVPD